MNAMQDAQKGEVVPLDELHKLQRIDKLHKDTYLGVVYAVEYGGNLKIASTKHPYSAIKALIRQIKTSGGDVNDFGKIYVSISHTNYRENESLLQKAFSESCVGLGKLYSITMQEFVAHIQNCNIEYRDETKEIEERSQECADFFKKMLFGR